MGTEGGAETVGAMMAQRGRVLSVLFCFRSTRNVWRGRAKRGLLRPGPVIPSGAGGGWCGLLRTMDERGEGKGVLAALPFEDGLAFVYISWTAVYSCMYMDKRTSR